MLYEKNPTFDRFRPEKVPAYLDEVQRLLAKVQFTLSGVQRAVASELPEVPQSVKERHECWVGFNPEPPILRMKIPILPPHLKTFLGEKPVRAYQIQRDYWLGLISDLVATARKAGVLDGFSVFKKATIWFSFHGSTRDNDNFTIKFIIDALLYNKIIEDDSNDRVSYAVVPGTESGHFTDIVIEGGILKKANLDRLIRVIPEFFQDKKPCNFY